MFFWFFDPSGNNFRVAAFQYESKSGLLVKNKEENDKIDAPGLKKVSSTRGAGAAEAGAGWEDDDDSDSPPAVNPPAARAVHLTPEGWRGGRGSF